MIQSINSKFISDTLKDSVYTAGMCCLFGFADPKAAAVATLASKTAGRCIQSVMNIFENPAEKKDEVNLTSKMLTVLSLAVLTISAGSLAGQQIDPNFNYSAMLWSNNKVHFVAGALVLGLAFVEASLKQPDAAKIENSETNEKIAPAKNQDSATATTIKTLGFVLPIIAGAALIYRAHQQFQASLKSLDYAWNLCILKEQAEMAARNTTSIFANTSPIIY